MAGEKLVWSLVELSCVGWRGAVPGLGTWTAPPMSRRSPTVWPVRSSRTARAG
ncbi:MAG: hypothetical protein ACRDS0_40780 [Pseudonocardiaceae bacterium]